MNLTEIKFDVSEIEDFVYFLLKECGCDFSRYAPLPFQRRLKHLLQVFNAETLSSLQKRIIKKNISCESIVQELTVNTTEMFRDPKFWKRLKKSVIPNLLKAKQFDLRIWQAACSSGEEVYSMAILLKELGILDQVKILATDINSEALNKAQTGVYSRHSLDISVSNYQNYSESFNGNFCQFYKELNDKHIQYDPELIRNVEFRRLDLIKEFSTGKFDLILIRNILIYFNPELQSEIIQLAQSALNKGGALGLGAGEMIPWNKANEFFKEIDIENKIYIKQ